MKVHRVGNSYRRSFQGGPRHVLLGLVPGPLDPAETPVIALPRAGTCDHGPLDPARIRGEVAKALSEVEAKTGYRVRLATIEYVPNDSPYYEMYYGHALAIAEAMADHQRAAVVDPGPEQPVFDQFASVRLVVPRPDLGLEVGARGAVVDVYREPRMGYHVEFFDSTGHTLAVEIMYPNELGPA
jgi:hypothetical protein